MTDLPPMNHLVHQPATAYCVVTAAVRFSLPVESLLGILLVENGRLGSKVKNTNGTSDLGPMQINTLWLEPRSPLNGYVTEHELKNNLCVNIHSAAWILSDQLKKTKTNDIWIAIGKYHAPYNKEFAWRYKLNINSKIPSVRHILASNIHYQTHMRALIGKDGAG